jgi:transcriptional regulator with XRE-family HTH domain
VGFDQEGFNREVGIRLQRARKQRDLTQADLAEALGIPRATYANVESGRQRIPVDILWRAAVVFDVPVEKLLPEPSRRPTETPEQASVLHGPTGPTYALPTTPTPTSK